MLVKDKIMKRMFKQWWSTILPIYQQNVQSLLTIVHKKKTTWYDVGNPGLGLGQTQKSGRIKLINNGIPHLLQNKLMIYVTT